MHIYMPSDSHSTISRFFMGGGNMERLSEPAWPQTGQTTLTAS